MKQVIGATAGFFLGGPIGALQGLAAGHMWDESEKAKKKQAASNAKVETGQRRAQGEADSERKRLAQDQARIGGGGMLRRRGPLTSYAGAQ